LVWSQSYDFWIDNCNASVVCSRLDRFYYLKILLFSKRTRLLVAL
jgi:hypothetical protein